MAARSRRARRRARGWKTNSEEASKVVEITGGRVVGRHDVDPAYYVRGYAPTNFYISSRTGGETANARWNVGKMPEQAVAIANKIIADPRFPYQNMGEYVRDAVHHRNVFLMKYLDQSDVTIGTYIEFIEILEMERLSKENELQVRAVESALETVTRLGDKASFDAIIQNGLAVARDLPEPWKTKLVNLVNHFKLGRVTFLPPQPSPED
jgi:hypothetical protein